mmetsp:Transcript_2739/g.3901  ORF Transcript_2739/g.3901 Transcript_2739/m.3901 type:complete len:330 (-) Transcript_2739:195-1184(-)|eukprot:CAMPEP_0117767670 /NCGR_PEP_ID=MMETSP0947-20121206/21809_1 /TAXON_ID=44440 /ORGANISM="Chattonella subsalsa, Strain CCMP2191" /LENGTH=329 /DNA_ID=CAMNT_0005591487 /DNA_START=16 /DNA_END=1005 /DNA_ORIENTATION=-
MANIDNKLDKSFCNQAEEKSNQVSEQSKQSQLQSKTDDAQKRKRHYDPEIELQDNEEEVKIGVIQMTSTDSVEANFQQVNNFVHKARLENVKMVFLPECFSFIGSKSKKSVDIAESLDGPIMERYKDLAARTELWISLGGFQEKCSTNKNKVFNSHVIINSSGEIVTVYRKMHLFDAPFLGLMESSFTEAGNQLETVETPVGTLGLSICYDLRFPEMFISMRKMGADVILVPSAFTCKTGSAHWEVLLRARAIETQCYIIAAAQCGQHNEQRESYGHSMVVDPWGDIVTQCSDYPSLGICYISKSYVNKIRRKMPVLEHRISKNYISSL